MIYRTVRLILKLLLTPLFRIRAEGLEAVPARGPVIIAANHKSFLDPVVLGIVLKRPVRFMAKKELFNIPLFGWLITRLGAFPVDRGKPDRASLRNSLEILENGEVLGIFVEGTRIKKPGIGEIKQGVYLISKMSRAPVVVAAIRGTRPLFKTPATVRFLAFDANPARLTAEQYTAELKKILEREIAE